MKNFLRRSPLAREEVVLFHADSIETLKQTRSRYFHSTSEIVAQMCGTISM